MKFLKTFTSSTMDFAQDDANTWIFTYSVNAIDIIPTVYQEPFTSNYEYMVSVTYEATKPVSEITATRLTPIGRRRTDLLMMED